MELKASVQKRLDADTIAGGSVTTLAALVVGYVTQGRIPSPPVWLLLGLGVVLCWASLTFFARAIFAREPGDVLRNSPLLLHWIGARLALVSAAWALFIALLIALPIGRPWYGIVGRALLLVLAISALTSLIGQGVINSAVLIARLRRSP